MAKTFDNISDALATNYLFLKAQRTLALQNEPLTPPPLYALGLPCHAMCMLWARLYPKKAESVAVEKKKAEAKEATNEAYYPAQNMPLAKKVTKYILEHQDDAAPEERWRTTMKRETMKRFCEQRDAIAEVGEQVQKIEARVQKVKTEMQTERQALQLKFDKVHSKMDEKMDQLIKRVTPHN